jgi:hypothetical protein
MTIKELIKKWEDSAAQTDLDAERFGKHGQYVLVLAYSKEADLKRCFVADLKKLEEKE